MVKEVICTGTTIEGARAAAIEQLQAPEDADVNVEVLELPVKKTFGLFGGAPAKVRAYYEESPLKKAIVYLQTILNGLGMSEVAIEEEQTEIGVSLNLNCGDAYGIVIGRRGETLDSIQYLTSLVANRGQEKFVRLSINVGNYREKRENTLRALARKNAVQVTKSGRNAVLEPMNPYERRIIHTTVQEIKGAISYSIGSGANRRVVITLAEGFQPTGGGSGKPRGGYRDQAGRNNRSGRPPYDRKPQEPRGQKPATQPHVPRKDPDPPVQASIPIKKNVEEPTRERHSDFVESPRYGKIEPKSDD